MGERTTRCPTLGHSGQGGVNVLVDSARSRAEMGLGAVERFAGGGDECLIAPERFSLPPARRCSLAASTERIPEPDVDTVQLALGELAWEG